MADLNGIPPEKITKALVLPNAWGSNIGEGGKNESILY